MRKTRRYPTARIPRSALLILAVWTVWGLSGCRKQEEETPYPLWFLSVTVVEYSESGSHPPVEGCPRLYWHYSTELDDNVESCRDGTNGVSVYRHIDETVTINYRVECEGYFGSGPHSYTFSTDSIYVHPGRGGPEVIHSERIELLKQ